MPENVRARGRIMSILRALREDTGEEVIVLSDKFHVLKVKLVGVRDDGTNRDVNIDDQGRVRVKLVSPETGAEVEPAKASDIETLKTELKGAGNRSLTDVYDRIEALESGLKGTGAKTLTDLDAKLSTIETNTGKLDIALSTLRDDLRGPDARTLTDVYDRIDSLEANLRGPDARTLTDVYNRIDTLESGLKGPNLKTLTDLDTRLGDILAEIQTPVYAVATGLDETVAQSITLDTKGKRLLEVYAKATAATTFRLDVSPDNSYWITDYMTWSAVTEVKETLWNGFRYVRLRSDAAGAAGDTVDLVLSAK